MTYVTYHTYHDISERQLLGTPLTPFWPQCGPVNGMLETLTSSRLKTMPSLSTRFWVLDSDHGSVICYTLHVVTCHVIPSWIQTHWHWAHLALTRGRFWPSLAPGSCDARPSFVVELLRSMQKRSLDWLRQRCFAGKSKHLGRIAFHVLNVFREVLTDFFLCGDALWSAGRFELPWSAATSSFRSAPTCQNTIYIQISKNYVNHVFMILHSTVDASAAWGYNSAITACKKSWKLSVHLLPHGTK